MDLTTAKARLSRMVAADQAPTLDDDALEELLALSVRPDASGNLPASADAAAYANATAYAAGTVVNVNGRYWQALSSGTSTGLTFPIGTVIHQETMTDGSDLVWLYVGQAWVPTWDLNHAAAEGWRWKAAQVANRFDFGSDNQTFSRSQFLAHCLEMADRYSKRYASTVAIGPVADVDARWAQPAYFLPT